MLPALIYRKLNEFADKNISAETARQNLDIIIDMHWIFLHSAYHKQQQYNWKKHIGKWKYYAFSYDDLFETTCKILPLIAEEKIPVAKFTNIGNVFSNEKLIVVYCFPCGFNSLKIKELLLQHGIKNIIWGSRRFPEPNIL